MRYVICEIEYEYIEEQGRECEVPKQVLQVFENEELADSAFELFDLTNYARSESKNLRVWSEKDLRNSVL